METMLKPKDLANVAAKLQVPLIVSDILNGREELSDETEYALHEAISDMQPDSALLCIALCGVRIAGAGGVSPSVRILEIECRKIIEEYAMLWLCNAENGEIDEVQAFETLSGAEEDLEALAGLFDNCMNLLERKNKNAAVLCNVMRVQARAQSLVAQAYFEVLGETPATPAPAIPVFTNNVIPFRVQKNI
jgi:hypothetical protein